MTREQALLKAHQFALERGWIWRGPVRVESYHPWWVLAMRWRVRSNDGFRGMNVSVEIDDQTGEVIKANFFPR
jgi:hypothetical protein